MNQLYAGFGRVNVTPMLGIGISGYFQKRNAKGVLDDLEIGAISLRTGDQRVVLLCTDVLGIRQEINRKIRQEIATACQIPLEAIYLHATHTHTGPVTTGEGDLSREYMQFFSRRAVDAARLAIQDEKPARMGIAVGKAPNIAFVRRYRMKDGSTQTNPGVNNPQILHPIGDVDERVSVLRFDQEGGNSLVLANFGCHPDVVGGELISSDWPGLSRRTLEKAIDGVKALVFNGAQGDINHVNVHPKPGFLNDTFHDFDDVSRGYGHARYMARVVAGAVMQVYDKVDYRDVEEISWAQRQIRIPSQMPRPEDMENARRIHALHREGKDDQIPFRGMMLTTVVAEAARMVRLEKGPEFFEMTLSAIRIGKVALVGFPGEPFCGIGKAVKETAGYDLVLPTCCTNGYQGYFPMKDAYDEGGYEARTSNFCAGVAEKLIREAKEMLSTL